MGALKSVESIFMVAALLCLTTLGRHRNSSSARSTSIAMGTLGKSAPRLRSRTSSRANR